MQKNKQRGSAIAMVIGPITKTKDEEISASTTKTKKLSVAERRAKRKTKKKSLYRIEEQTTTVDESNDGDDEVLDLSMDEVMI